jgi:hypothetical protein
VNTANTGYSYGVYAHSQSPSGRGVFGYASAISGETTGVYGRSDSATGAGVVARGLDEGPDLILAGNADTVYGDDGRIMSDPAYPSSDIHLIANDGFRFDLDQNGDGEDADFEIRDRLDALIFNVDESGAVTFGGAGIAAFPRPAYDSGWVAMGLGGTASRTHNLGSSTDRYVIDLTCQQAGGAGVSGRGLGGDTTGTATYGAWWSNLTTTVITLNRAANDVACASVRVRIWLYP